MGACTHTGSRKNLLGSDPEVALTELTSVEKQITPNYPPTFVWCGNADRTVAPENSRMLAKELEKNGISHRFVEYPGVDHGVGLGIGLACEKWFEESVAFWENQRNIMR